MKIASMKWLFAEFFERDLVSSDETRSLSKISSVATIATRTWSFCVTAIMACFGHNMTSVTWDWNITCLSQHPIGLIRLTFALPLTLSEAAELIYPLTEPAVMWFDQIPQI